MKAVHNLQPEQMAGRSQAQYTLRFMILAFLCDFLFEEEFIQTEMTDPILGTLLQITCLTSLRPGCENTF